MGQPKLLMQVAGKHLIQWLVEHLRHPGIGTISILVRPDDAPLQELVATLPVELVIAKAATKDMKASVSLLTRHLDDQNHVTDDDGFLLIPADHPIVFRSVIDQLIDVWSVFPGQVVVPKYDGRRGHPVIFPWWLTRLFAKIPDDQGLNWLLRLSEVEVHEVQCAEPSILWDVDTPEDFARIRREFENFLKS